MNETLDKTKIKILIQVNVQPDIKSSECLTLYTKSSVWPHAKLSECITS